MTRISDHAVIQMVGDDRLVFVSDSTGEEHVLPIADAVKALEEWGPAADRGESFGPSEGMRFEPGDYNAVEAAIDYFFICSGTPAEQAWNVELLEVDSMGDLARALGLRTERP